MLEKVAITKAKVLFQVNYSVEPVSCYTCHKCGDLMDEETANIVDNPPVDNLPGVCSWIRCKKS